MKPVKWIVLTGEYPPQFGGVSDYTLLLGRGLANAGDEVHVCAPCHSEIGTPEPGIVLHRLPHRFGLRGLRELTRLFETLPSDACVIVQYVPHAFGWKAMNVPFCLWLLRQRRRRGITIMFHEVAFPWVKHGKIVRHNFLAAVSRLMALLLVRSAQRLCVSTPAWRKILYLSADRRKTVEWIPVPSNLPELARPEDAKAVRERFVSGPESRLIGHFGTFGDFTNQALFSIIPAVLTADQRVIFNMIGPGGPEFVKILQRKYPAAAGRVFATGILKLDEIPGHLVACDLLIQVYPDGISGRRGTAMAGLSCGVPILTNVGVATETIWKTSGAVCLVNSIEDVADRVSVLLDDRAELDRLKECATRLYRERFHVDRMVAAFRCHQTSSAHDDAGIFSALGK